jgi:hypothetical protein
MKSLLSIYCNALFRPFHTHRELRLNRTEPMDTVEAISLSWMFSSAKALYSLIAIIFALYWLDQSPNLNDSFAVNLWATQVQRFTVYVILLEFILFPIGEYFYMKFWGLVIKFFCLLFELEEDNRERLAREVANYSLASNVFLAVPIFGQLLRHLAGLFLIYAGLRNNIGFNPLQAAIVLLAPLLLVMFFIFLSMLYIVLIISLF